MILSTCGYDPHRRFTRKGGCGIWVGYGLPYPFAYPFRPVPPYFYEICARCGITKVRPDANGDPLCRKCLRAGRWPGDVYAIAWCRWCAQGLFWVHKGQGIFAWEGPEELREGCEERNPTRGYVLCVEEGDSRLPSRKGEN